MGTRTVALDMSQLHFLRDDTDVSFAAVTSSREALEVAPEYRGRRTRPQGAASPVAVDPTDAAAPSMPRPVLRLSAVLR
jgi:hypothetical protein